MPTPTFLVTPLPRARRVLRRYQGLAGGWACMPRQRHEATVVVPGTVPAPLDQHQRLFSAADSAALAPFPSDALWPAQCMNPVCPGATRDGRPTGATYVFDDGDPREVEHERLGRREDTGEEVLVYCPPVGGIVEAWWMAGHGVGPDSKSLAVWTLDGFWCLDVPGRAGETFQWSGEDARLTVVQTAGPAWRWSMNDGVLDDGGSGG